MPVPAQHQAAVDYLRLHGAAAQTDSYDGVTYWTDDQLYAILQRSIVFTTLGLIPVNSDRTIFRYNAPLSYCLDEDTLEFIDMPDMTTTYDPDRRTFTFTSSPFPAGEIRYFKAGFFHYWKALSELWDAKAEQRHALIRVKAGANQMFLEQEYEHCIDMAAYYRKKTLKKFRV